MNKTITTDIVTRNGPFNGDCRIYEVNGPGIKSGLGSETVTTKEKPSLSTNGNTITYTFPPHSFTLMKTRIKK